LGQPLHFEVYKDLYNKILTGYYSVGSKLPTEVKMESLYQVSRTTIRQALRELQDKGLINSKPGIGTVVTKDAPSVYWPPVGGFSSTFSKKWNRLIVKTINVSNVIPEKDVVTNLKLGSKNAAVEVTRIRKENNIPVFLLINYYANVDVNKIKEAGDILNMRQFAKEVLGVDFYYVTEEITAFSSDNMTSYYLEIEKGTPLLQIKRVSYDTKFQPVEYVKYYVNSTDWPYNITYENNSHDFPL